MTKKSANRVADALGTVAAELRGAIVAGQDISGVLHTDDLEVEITMRVKRRTSCSQSARYARRALALLEIEGWRDNCPRSVPNRSPWRSASSRTTSCSGKVSAAIVYRHSEWEEGPLRPGEHRALIACERFVFVCRHHEDVNGSDVLAVVRLEKNALRNLRTKRERETAERRAIAATKERALEAEVSALSDTDLSHRLSAAISADDWTAEDICAREQRRRARERATKPAAPPLSPQGDSCRHG